MNIIVGIVVFKNNLEILSKSLDMLFKQQFTGKKEIIILDNDNGNQINDIQSIIKDNNVTFIKSNNIGFGAGHNKIFSYANNKIFDYYLAVNPDGVPHYKMLDNLIKFAKSKQDKGIFESIQFPSEHPKVYDSKEGITDWCSGCCCLFPFTVFDYLGGFDDRFFMYMEDIDLSWRARIAGYNCYLVNNALFSHSVNNEDRDGKGQEIMMQKSAYILAKKYGNRKWVNDTKIELNKTIGKKELDKFILSNEDLLQIELTQKQQNIPNFNHRFHFSKVRW